LVTGWVEAYQSYPTLRFPVTPGGLDLPIRLMTVYSGELLVSIGLNSRTRWFRTQSATSFCVTDLYNPIIMRIGTRQEIPILELVTYGSGDIKCRCLRSHLA